MKEVCLTEVELNSFDPKDFLLTYCNCDDLTSLDGEELIRIIKDDYELTECSLTQSLDKFREEMSGNSFDMFVIYEGKINRVNII